MSTLRVVFQPGVGNSEREHWQSIWARGTPDAVWVEQRDWDHPVRDEWVATLAATVRGTPGRKVIVAHSLGCLAVADAAAVLLGGEVIGAFVVAVPDVSSPQFPREAVGFRPALELSLPFPSVLVASADDPYASLEYAQRVARRWGSQFVQVGAAGHINARSGLGAWAEGRRLFESFVATL
jgi:predicted alpha/beta hydrolase family esterase